MKLLSSILIALAVIVILNSCKQKGCTDAKAYNFCYDCKKDDRTCVYYGTAVFWWNPATNDSLLKYNINQVELFSEAATRGYYSLGQHWYTSAAPGCDQRGIFNYSRELINGIPADVTYQVLNSANKQVIWSGTLNLDINHCQIIQLTWKP
jgi:hypothetical protein